MANLFTSLKFKAILLFALLFFISAQVEASHFRYGTVTWQITSFTPTTRTVQFNITQSWRWSAFGSPTNGSTTPVVGLFNFGDATTANLSLIVTSVNSAEDWFVGSRTLTKTYSVTTDVTAFFDGCCRISSLQQGNNDQAFRTETRVTLSNPVNRPPVGSTLPIFYVQTGLPSAQIHLNATDPDNDPISFAISSSAQSGLVTTTPAIVTSLSSSGLLSINTNAIPINRQYAMQVTVSDNKGARIPLDFIIQVVGVSNPPVFDYTITPLNASTIKVQPGTPINFTVKARDIDSGSTVSLNASGIPAGASLSAQSGTNPSQFTFSWTPTIANLGSYSLSFSATDNIFVQTLTNVNLVVSTAPVFNVPPTPVTGVYNVVAPGQNLSFTVQATDPDPLDACSITEVNGKDNLNNKIPIYAGVTMSPTLPTASANSTSSLFSWTPTQAQWGLNPVIFTAKDSYGDKTDHEVNILVNTVPQFTSVPVTSVIATQNYQYNITSTDPDVVYGDDLELHSTNVLPAWLTLTDNGDGTGTLSGTPGLADAGTYNISLQVEDIYHHTNAGGIPTQTFTIEVIPCVIEISGTSTDLSCAGDNSGAIDLTLTGTYGTATFAWTGPNGYTAATDDISGLAAGSYTVVVSSDLGCTKTETFVVGTMPDVIPPTITCPTNITVGNDPGKCGAIVVFNVTGSDNCSGVTVVSSPASGSVFPIGETIVSSVATDASGHEATCSFTVTVDDNEAPVATGYDATFTAQYFTGTNFNVLAVNDEVPAINNHWYYGSPHPAEIGVDNFSIRYTGTTVAPATGNYTFRTFSDDGIRLWVNGQLVIDNWTLHPGTYNTGSILLTANQQVDIKLEFFEAGGYAIAYLEWLAPFAGINSYQVVPARSNSCKSLTIKLDESGLASITTADLDPGFTDACGIASMTISKTNFDCSNIGPNTVILTVTDNHGNVSTCNAMVTVKDDVAPVAIAQNVIVQLDNTGNGSTSAAQVNNGSNDACGIASLVLSKTAFTCADIGSNLNTVTLTVSDNHGNVSTATAEITVKDEVPANVITKNITVQLDATGNIVITADQVDDGSSDACGIASMSVSPNAFTCSNVGNNTVTLTVTDVNGNVSSQTAVVKVEDNILPTWVTVAGSLDRSVSCGNTGTLAAAMALAPTVTDNCSVTLSKTTGTQIGNTITNTWLATDASGNASSVFTQVITITAVTIDASGSSTPVALGSTATLYAIVTPAEAGITVTFKLDQGTVAYGTYGIYTAITNASGIATKTVSGLTVEVYRVYAIAGDGCASSTAYLAVFDPNGSFVTGGGWITSPVGAYVADPALTGKANFGFVSKYKKGSNIPDGNTEFQFQTGNLNFSSSSYNTGSLVIAGKQAIYKGIGTINGVSGFSFMVSTVDGQVSGGGGIDMFRMKIWNTSTGAIVYDNNISTADNATPTTALGGGSVVIHATSNKSATMETDAAILNPVVEGADLKVYPNPFTEKLIFEFVRKTDTKATLILFDAVGRKLSVLFDQQMLANENYRLEYVPKDLSTNMLFYRMTFNDEVINGKMIYKK